MLARLAQRLRGGGLRGGGLARSITGIGQLAAQLVDLVAGGAQRIGGIGRLAPQGGEIGNELVLRADIAQALRQRLEFGRGRATFASERLQLARQRLAPRPRAPAWPSIQLQLPCSPPVLTIRVMHPFLIAAAAALLALFLALIQPDRRGMRTLRVGAVAALLTILGAWLWPALAFEITSAIAALAVLWLLGQTLMWPFRFIGRLLRGQ